MKEFRFSYDSLHFTDEHGQFNFYAPVQDAVYGKVLNDTLCWREYVVNAKNLTLLFEETSSFQVNSNIDQEAVLVDQNQPSRRHQIPVFKGQQRHCLKWEGDWHFSMKTMFTKYMKYEQDTYILQPEMLNNPNSVINVIMTHYLIAGQLRFYSEDDLLEGLDHLVLHAFGQEFEFDDIQEAQYDELFRDYKIWIPANIIDRKDEDPWIYPVVKNPDLALVSKPARKLNEFETRNDLLKDNMHYHFKLIKGMFVSGQTTPPIPDTLVSLQRENRIGLKDRVPTFIYTDELGKFKHGPTEIDNYEVKIEKKSQKIIKIET